MHNDVIANSNIACLGIRAEVGGWRLQSIWLHLSFPSAAHVQVLQSFLYVVPAAQFSKH